MGKEFLEYKTKVISVQKVLQKYFNKTLESI